MRNKSEISDSELLNLLTREGSSFAFEEIYNRYWDKLYGAAYKRLRSNEAAEELVQDLFADIWTRRGSLNINTLLPVYLYTAIRYRVINYVHKEMVKSSYQQHVILTDFDFDNSTEEIVIASDLNHQIQTQVELLPIKCREVFELSRNEHKSNKEIAQSLGISEKTVENHITKALRRLRVSLNTFLFLL
jgi:RNA polymerase sigma-70 factor (ECF subfamily)